ncbi:hypothetical protein LCGC14_2884440, partial [marine sediment metagenome]
WAEPEHELQTAHALSYREMASP